MVDRRRIVDLWTRGSPQALVTLVHTEGSSYRRPGAHLLIAANGDYAGTISGGCLESEVVRKAVWMVRNGAVVERYSTLFDDTAEIPFGLGCGGIVDLLLEPADTPECAAFVEAMGASLSGAAFRIATWLPHSGKPLARVVLAAHGTSTYASPSLSPAERATISATNWKPGFLASDMPPVYCETLAPPQRLFVLGAGDDAKPVVTMAAQLGWRITVAEGRPQLTRPERFPDAERVLATTSIADLGLTASDAAVIMSHSYEQDRTLLTGLLGAREVPGYIGLLGASHRSSLLLSEASAALGVTISSCCDRVWAPVGLDLGGDGAEAIALAVIAEVHAWREGRLGASRRLTAQHVTEQIAKGGASRYLQTQCALGAAE